VARATAADAEAMVKKAVVFLLANGPVARRPPECAGQGAGAGGKITSARTAADA
jgi:hypothetical protein